MRAVLVSALAVAFVTACTWMQPLDLGADGRRNARIAITAYEATQQAMLIYGRLPGCDKDSGVTRFCRNAAVWNKIKIADKLATTAIVQAAPILEGKADDGGEVVKALAAIEQVKDALKEAQSELNK